jgi:tetratricopeptide (TPR) repeat protein
MKPNNEIMNSGLKPSEYVNYEAKIEFERNELAGVIARSRRAKDVRYGTWGMSVISYYNMMAKSYVMLKDYPEARRNFHNAARFAIELLQIQAQKRFPKLLQEEKQRPFYQRFIEGFPEAILADDEVLLHRFADAIDHNEHIVSGQKFSHLITAAIKFLVLGNLDKAREYAVQSHKLEYFRLPYKGYSHAVLGIIERDTFLLNEGIEMRVKSHKGREYGTVFWEFSHEAAALAKLAVRAGLHPNIQTSFVPAPLVHTGERTSDDTIDQILGGLEVANERSGSLVWSFLRILPGVR